MSRIQKAFRKRKEQGGKLFIPYFCAGDPDVETSLELLLEADRAGADLIEVGIPFSDPSADGPTIQEAILRSLHSGTRLKNIFELVSKFREQSDTPVVIMTYYNPVLRYGEQRFVETALEAGVDGLLIVDLPPEEGMGFFKMEQEKGMETVLLATPTTSLERVEELSRIANGFLYYVLVKGVTGVRGGYEENMHERLVEISKASERPVVVGFGVSGYDAIKNYIDAVDGVVVGSALARLIAENVADRAVMCENISELVTSLTEPLHSVES